MGHGGARGVSLLTDIEGFPTICDATYATMCVNDAGRAATLHWAKSEGYGIPLVLLDWENEPLMPVTVDRIGSRMAELADRCRVRYGALGLMVEDEAIAQQASYRDVPARAIPSHMLLDKFWQNLCTLAAFHVDSGSVKLSRIALRKVQEANSRHNRGFAALPRVVPGPRGDDPTVPAWLFGIVLGLDEGASRPPEPTKVKLTA